MPGRDLSVTVLHESGWYLAVLPDHAGEQYQLQSLADQHGEDAVLDWLRAGVPTPRLDVPTLADLLAAGVTEQRYRWLVSGQ